MLTGRCRDGLLKAQCVLFDSLLCYNCRRPLAPANTGGHSMLMTLRNIKINPITILTGLKRSGEYRHASYSCCCSGRPTLAKSVVKALDCYRPLFPKGDVQGWGKQYLAFHGADGGQAAREAAAEARLKHLPEQLRKHSHLERTLLHANIHSIFSPAIYIIRVHWLGLRASRRDPTSDAPREGINLQ